MTKYFSFILFITSIFLHAADRPEIEIIKAMPKPLAFPSLKTLTLKTIIQQMRISIEKGDTTPCRKLIQEYADKSQFLPEELLETFKKKLSRHGMDILTTIHTTQPIYPPSEHCLSPDGTLLLYQSRDNPHQFVLKNLNTQEEERIEHVEFSGITWPRFPSVTPFITEHNSTLFYISSHRAISSRVFKYCPKTKTVEKRMLSFPIHHLYWACTDMNKLFFSKGIPDDNVLYDTQTSVESRIQGYTSHIHDDYITTTHNNRFHCYTTHDGNIYMQGGEGSGESIINFPHLICAKKTDPTENSPTSLEIWNIPHKQPIRRIVLPMKIDDFLPCKPDRVEITSGSAFCSINLQNGSYKERNTSLERKKSEYSTNVENSLLMRDGLSPSRYYVVHVLTRKLSIPLVELNGKDVTSCYYANKEMTRIGGLLEGCLEFVYTTPLHTLYNTPLAELFNMLLKK